MSSSETQENEPKLIELDEEIEGDQTGSREYRFSRIGDPVPVKPDWGFDPESPPSQPLAVSETFRRIFVAHSNGFYIARTEEVMEAAEEIKDKGNGRSIQDLSTVDISIGQVSILALSTDDSTLAVSVGHRLHFFAVSSLLHKEREPSFSVSVDESSCIVDMRWVKRMEKGYIVLSRSGKLYQGSGRGPLTEVMDNVDAVDWSVRGDFVAVARKNVLSVFSPEFKEKFSLLLSFKSVIGDSDDNSVIKVNSIRWARSDCIVIGCLQLNDDGEEENYIVQVITSKEGKITDTSSKPIVLSFSDVLMDYRGDAVPSASGPHMFLSYLDHQQLAFVANRKNHAQHVVLLGWAQNEKENEAVTIEILNDTWTPHIEVQGNDDENLILGLSIDKVSQNEEVRLVVGAKEREASPCCILLCLTIDGKLSLFHFASARGASVLPEAYDISHEEEDASHKVQSEHRSSEFFSHVGEESRKQALQMSESHDLSRNQLFNREEVKVATRNDQSPALSMSKPQGSTTENQEEKPVRLSQISIGDEQQTFPLSKLHQDSDIQHTSFSGQPVTNLKLSSLQTSQCVDSEPVRRDLFKKDSPANFETKSSTGFFSPKNSNDVSTQAISNNLVPGRSTESKMMVSTGSHSTPPLSWSTGAANSSKTASEKSIYFPSAGVQKSEISDRSVFNFSGGPLQGANASNTSSGKSLVVPSTAVRKAEVSSKSALSFSGGQLQNVSQSKEAVSPSLSVNSFGQIAPAGAGNIQQLAAFRGSQVTSEKSSKSHQNKDNGAASLKGVLNPEPNSMKQYRNIEEMAKKLDHLLEGIEGKGGFKDASIASQESSVVALEEGIRALSHRCRVWEGTMDEQLREIQQLLDKTVQVLARKTYIEGIFKQASDGRYWGLWNRQKLSSELELKRCHIVELNQELTNQLIKLERHFNTLELSRFGENGVSKVNPRTSQSRHGQTRHVQSLRSLHNTMNAQLAAAEQLSECLSKQMAVLNIDSPVKKQNVKKELFDTIGLSYDDPSYSSPGKEKVPATPSNKGILICSRSLATNEPSRRNQSSLAKSYEPETARRRRDSLDRTWVSFDPPKTTVKRILLQDDHEKMGASRFSVALDKPHLPLQKGTEIARSVFSSTSSTSLFQSQGKGLPDISAKQVSKGSSNALFQWADSVPDPLMNSSTKALVSPSPFAVPPTSSAGQNNSKGTQNLNDEMSRGRMSFIGKTESAQHSVTPVHQAPPTTTRLPVQTPPAFRSSIQGSDNNTENMKPTPTISPASAVISGPSISGKVLDVETSASRRQSGEAMSSFLQSSSSSSLPSTISFSSSPFSSSTLKPSEPKLFPGMSFSSKESQTSVTSVAFPSNFSFSYSEKTVPSSSFPPSTSASSESLKIASRSSDASELEPKSNKIVAQPSDVSDPKPDQISSSKTSLASFSTKMDNIYTITASTQQPPTADLKSEASVLSTTTMQPTTSLKSDNDISLGGVLSPAPDKVSNATPAKLGAVEVPSSTSLDTGIISSAKNVISDAATDEDEMEEEAPETSQTTELTLGSLGGFGIGSTPTPTHTKPNPFGVSMNSGTSTPLSSPFTMQAPGGELFRPASFSFQPLQPSQPSQPTSFGGGFNTGNTGQAPTVSGFGRPAQIGSGQQALGSVLGTFGQSRQFGAGLPGSGIAPASGFGTVFSGQTSGGFGGGFAGVGSTSAGFGSPASIGGGFAAVAPAGGGFAAAATAGGGFAAAASAGGGFAAAASAGGGFAAAATGGGGFAAAATGGGGFAAAATGGAAFSGGFGAFGNQQGGGGGFSAFGNSSGTARPPSELLTQMRK